ncbi:hypothetical protein ABT034_26440 [Streptomyces sp. NPDC002773]|uniref:hypothetical protein n=1 Tax=Streptomyces sp. NPDC002773 TaxID=3154430 RepID=UPI0033238346
MRATGASQSWPASGRVPSSMVTRDRPFGHPWPGGLQRLALGLGLLGRRVEARETAREAVGLWRLLVGRGIDGSRGELAGALVNLGNQLAETGRPKTAGDRTVRDLAEHATGAFAAARTLTGLGRTDEARPYFAEAAVLRAEGGERDPAILAFGRRGRRGRAAGRRSDHLARSGLIGRIRSSSRPAAWMILGETPSPWGHIAAPRRPLSILED